MHGSILRTFPLDDIVIRAEGDGRVVDAYAAVFDVAIEVNDWMGPHEEVILPGAFDRSIEQRGTRFGVFYNHGQTIQGWPSGRHSMPIGTPQEVRADSRGLRTITKYAKTELADEVLELIRDGAITGQSFSARIVEKKEITRADDPDVPKRIEFVELALREYGPTPFPAYEQAEILSVRSQTLAGLAAGLTPEDRMVIAQIARRLSPDERDALARMLDQHAGLPAAAEPAIADAAPGARPADGHDTPPTAAAAALSPAAPVQAGPSIQLLLARQANRRRRAS